AGTGLVDAVDVDADRRIGADAEIVGFDAAQAVGRLGRVAAVDHQPRHEQVGLAEVGGGDHAQLSGGDDGHRDRHILHFLAAALRGDRDLAQFGGVDAGAGRRRGSLLCRRERYGAGRAGGERAGNADGESVATDAHEAGSPGRMAVASAASGCRIRGRMFARRPVPCTGALQHARKSAAAWPSGLSSPARMALIPAALAFRKDLPYGRLDVHNALIKGPLVAKRARLAMLGADSKGGSTWVSSANWCATSRSSSCRRKWARAAISAACWACGSSPRSAS